MFEVTSDLDAEHQAVLAALPFPIPPAGARCLRAASARDHADARLQRHAARALPHSSGRRAGQLRRAAALADARATELAGEAR